jgi:menaquinone-dependent protoporphyrinogen IX oxidase
LPNWRAEELELMLGDLTRPIEVDWEAFTKIVIAERIKLEKFVETVTMERTWIEKFMLSFIE